MGKNVHTGEEQQEEKDRAWKTPKGQRGHEGGITPREEWAVSNDKIDQARRRWLEDLFSSVTGEVNRPQRERTIAKRAWLSWRSCGLGEMERASPFVVQCFGVLNVLGTALPVTLVLKTQGLISGNVVTCKSLAFP